MVNNLPLQWGNKTLDYLAGEPFRTRVVLTNDEGTYYPVFFETEMIEKPDAELLEMALQIVYEKNYSHKAEQEKFQEYDSLIKELKQAIKTCNEATAENELKMNKGIAEMLTLIATLQSESAMANLLPSEEDEGGESNVDDVEKEAGEPIEQPTE